MNRLTIFTPAYNRAYTLPILYESLVQQTFQDFEWLIVDDGSTDNTKDLVDGWMREGRVYIRYFYRSNTGKMQATNFAAQQSSAELFVCIDSDDRLVNENVLKDSIDFWDKRSEFLRKQNETHELCGMISRRLNPSIVPIEDPGQPCVGTAYEIACGKGETTIFTRTEILRQYPYPKFEGETFITDCYIHDAMSYKYRFLYHPYYSQLVEYQRDGYTKNYRKILLANPRGHREFHAQCIRLHKTGWIKSVICYISLSLFIRDHTMFSASPNIFLTVLFYPLGCLKYLYDRYMLFKENNIKVSPDRNER